MALFFDQAWFDQKLKTLGFDRAVIASALGLTPEQIDEIWKDQRELSAREVATIAALLQSEPAEIAVRAGVSTPNPATEQNDGAVGVSAADLAEVKQRLERVEQKLDELTGLIQSHLIPR